MMKHQAGVFASVLVLAAAGVGGAEPGGPAPATPPAQKPGDAPPLIPLFPSPVGADSSDVPMPVTPLAHVEVMGSGPLSVVLIPGMACDWTVFKTFMERNTERYTMYAVTLPGFGKGAFKPPKWPEDDYCSRKWLKNAVRAIALAMDERQLKKPLIIGHGLGGHLAIWLALEFPDRVGSVVSIDGLPQVPLAGGDPRGTVEGRRFQIKQTILPNFQLAEEEWRIEQIRAAERLVTDNRRAKEIGLMVVTPPRQVAMRYNLEYIVSDLNRDMPRNSVPMLFIASESPDFNRILLDRLHSEVESVLGAPPKAQLVYFENCRHFVMDEDPARLDRTVDQFVRGERIPGAKGGADLHQDAAEEPVKSPAAPPPQSPR